MNSIFDIEEKTNKEVDEDYLVSNGWKLEDVGFQGWVYIKSIRHKTRPARFIRLCYSLDTFPKRTLRNLNNRETIKVNNVTDFEIIVNKWVSDWEVTPFLEYYNVQIF